MLAGLPPHSELGANFRGNSPGASPRLSASSVFSGVDMPRSPLRSSLRVSAPPRQIHGLFGSRLGLGPRFKLDWYHAENPHRLGRRRRELRLEEDTSELQSLKQLRCR